MRIPSMFRRGAWVSILTLVVTAGCQGLFDIKNPGQILDDDLNDPALIPVLISGLSSDVSDFVDDMAFDVARLTDEMAGSGSYTDTGLFRRGYAEQDQVGYVWDQAQEARWMADLHIARIQELVPDQFDNNRYVARAYMFQGVANKALGENYCQVVYSDPDGTYGNLLPPDSAFERAIKSFQNSLAMADTSPYFQAAAHAGLASAYIGLDNWDMAQQEAAQVPTDFVVYAYYDYNDDTNEIYVETHQRPEMSAIQTLAGSFDPPDPRAPFTMCDVTGTCQNAQGADGETPHWRQEKYADYGTDIPILSGKEARLIEAEYALRHNDLTEFTNQINQVRALYNLSPITEPATAGALEYPNAYDDGWSILDAERELTLWLEGHRLFDLRRWDHPFLQGGTVVWQSDPVRDECMPVPASECRYNPNFTCAEAAAAPHGVH